MTHKRITERQIQEGVEGEAAALIAGEARHGFLDGVEIDFRHHDLSTDWEPLPQWFVPGPPPIHAGVILPSDIPAVIVEAARLAAAGEAELAAQLRDEMGELVELGQGDKVS